jgi:nucleoside-diphosphate-sugar epimerase
MTARLAEAGHELVLVDIEEPPDIGDATGISFVQCDVQAGSGLERVASGCDLVLHTAAWHGLHGARKTEIDYWRLNVDGTFWLLQAMLSAAVPRLVFLSSLAWHDQYEKYGFTKRIGEQLCDYHRHRHRLNYIAVRPADFTPWGNDYVGLYGQRLLYGGVDREDVLDCITLAIEHLRRDRPDEGVADGLIVNAVRPNAFDQTQLHDWERNPLRACEDIFPGSAELVTKYEIDVRRRPMLTERSDAAALIGYAPRQHFGTFLDELRRLDAAGGKDAVRAVRCSY